MTAPRSSPNALTGASLSLTSGAIFGAALTASRVYLPSVILHQMQLRDHHMLKVFLTASATSAIVLYTLERRGVAPRQVRSNATLGRFGRYDANIIGGALIGVGMATTGACPGTVVVQLATGVPSSTYVALGAVAGGMFHAKAGHALTAPPTSTPPPKAETISSKLDINPSTIFLAFETTCVAAVALASFTYPSTAPHTSIHPILGGLLIGLAQGVSVLLTKSTLGVSTAYDQLARYTLRLLSQPSAPAPPSPPRALFFALGIFLGSAALSRSIPRAPVDQVQISKVAAAVGGFVMIDGARMAGGCTSGHGISGLSAFSWASLVTVAAMFGGRIGAAMVWGGGDDDDG